ncbi:MAG: DNA recombination protein RmuC [Bacteroidales bacterium]|nr:DNA recombination protein RmuC [Bacteroidales bacterium]
MNATITIAIIAAVIIIAIVIAWILSASKAKAAFQREIGIKETEVKELTGKIAERDADLIRKEADIRTAEALRDSEREQHEKALAELKAGQEKAIEAAKTALALENEKILKAREEALKKEAAETMKAITGGLDQNIKDMKDAFEAQKKSHAEETSSIKTQFAETVKHLKEQTESIGSKAENLASALKGQNKMQGIFGETILENILKAEGLREGHDYDAEFWLRDRKGNIIVNEETGKRMRPDFALHFPDDTDILIDSKVSLSALSDYFAAETDEERADASRRNLESVLSHIGELTSKEYQKHVEGRKTLDYVIMFIPNYGAYQLAKQEDKDIFAKAFQKNVLITTEETLIPFLRLIRTAWVQKEQMENISEIVSAAQEMVNRVGIFCHANAELEKDLEDVLDGFKENTKRLVDGKKSIVKAAIKAIHHGIQAPTGKNALPAIDPGLSDEE